MELKDGIQTFYAASQKDWREWLDKNHQSEKSVWLIIYKKESGIPSVYYSEAVDEAICFGWIDSKPNKRDGPTCLCWSGHFVWGERRSFLSGVIGVFNLNIFCYL